MLLTNILKVKKMKSCICYGQIFILKHFLNMFYFLVIKKYHIAQTWKWENSTQCRSYCEIYLWLS